ncbi:MAG: DUF1987 domain-containing protein [Candidatus Kapaibacterium sp.]
MENLNIKETGTTPEIVLDANSARLSFSGESYPENALDFYKKIFEWIKSFATAHKGGILVEFNLIYFNTSSSKAIMDILDILDGYHRSGAGEVTVKWYYQEEDEDILETGEEFAEGLELNFEFVSI